MTREEIRRSWNQMVSDCEELIATSRSPDVIDALTVIAVNDELERLQRQVRRLRDANARLRHNLRYSYRIRDPFEDPR